MRLNNRGPVMLRDPARVNEVGVMAMVTPFSGLDHKPERYADPTFHKACTSWLKVCYYETMTDSVEHALLFSTYSNESKAQFICETPEACVLALAETIMLDETAMRLQMTQAGARVGQPNVLVSAYPRTVAALRMAVALPVRDSSTDQSLALVANGLVALAHWSVVDPALGQPLSLLEQVRAILSAHCGTLLY